MGDSSFLNVSRVNAMDDSVDDGAASNRVCRVTSHCEVIFLGELNDEDEIAYPESIVSTQIFRVATDRKLRIFMNLVICANAIEMGLATDVNQRPWKDVWIVCDNVFTAVFAFEMVLHLAAFRCYYFLDYWNWLDFFVANVAIVNTWILPGLTGGNRALGSFKTIRLLRLFRIFKMIRVIPELAVLTTAMLGSVKSLLWIVVLLLMVLYAAAITCVEAIGREAKLYPGFSTNTDDMDSHHMAAFNPHLMFGTVARSMLSLFNLVLLDEWGPIVRPVFEKQFVMVLFFIVIVVICAFGILNLVFGVVVESTTQAMNQVRQDEIRKIKQKQCVQIEQLAEVFWKMDSDGDQKINRKEMTSGKNNYHLQDLLSTIPLPLEFTFSELFDMLDTSGDGLLSKRELVSGMIRLLHCNEFQRDLLTYSSLGQLRRFLRKMREDLTSTISTNRRDLEMQIRAATTTILTELRQTCEHSSSATQQAASGQLQPSPADSVVRPVPEAVCEPTHLSTLTSGSNSSLHPALMEAQRVLQTTSGESALRRDIRDLREEIAQSFHENRYELALLGSKIQANMDRMSKAASLRGTEAPWDPLKQQPECQGHLAEKLHDWSSTLNDLKCIVDDLKASGNTNTVGTVLRSNRPCSPPVFLKATASQPDEPLLAEVARDLARHPGGLKDLGFGCLNSSLSANASGKCFINPAVVSNYWTASDMEGKIKSREHAAATWQHFIVEWVSRNDTQRMNFAVVGDVKAAKDMKKAIEEDLDDVAKIITRVLDAFTIFPLPEDHFWQAASDITHQVCMNSQACQNIRRVSERYPHVTDFFKASLT